MDALARTSPSQPTAITESESSAPVIPAQSRGGKSKLIPALFGIIAVLSAILVFINLPDEVSVPVKATAIEVPKEHRLCLQIKSQR